MEPWPLFNESCNEHSAYWHESAAHVNCDIRADNFPFANGVGPGDVLSYRFHDPDTAISPDIHVRTDSDRETDESLYDSHIRWLNAVADRNARRNLDPYPSVDQHPETVYDPDNPTERLADSDSDFPCCDNNEHARTGYVGKPGTYYTDQHGTIHLTLDTWEQARERNRARYGNANASEQHYREDG